MPGDGRRLAQPRVPDSRAQTGVPVAAQDDVLRLAAPPLRDAADEGQEGCLLLGLIRLVLVHIDQQKRHL